MKRRKNLIDMNIFIIVFLIVLLFAVTILLIIDYRNNFNSTTTMYIESWASIFGSIIGVLGTVGITMFFYNKNEIAKIEESFLEKWESLNFIKDIYLSSKNDEYLEKSNASSYIIKYDMSKSSIKDFYIDIEKFDDLCVLLQEVDRKGGDNFVEFITLGLNENAVFLSFYHKSRNILVIQENIELIKVELGKRYQKNIEVFFNNLNNDDEFIDAVNISLKEMINTCNIEKMDIFSFRNLESVTNKYIKSEIRKRYKSKGEISTEEYYKFRQQQLESIEKIYRWSVLFNKKFNESIKKFKVNKNYNEIIVYFEMLKIYKKFVEDKNYVFVNENSVGDRYNVQFVEYNWALNSYSESNTFISIDKIFIENIFYIHDKITKLI